MIGPNRVAAAAPEITLTIADRDRLLDLANAALYRLPDVAALLLEEADRAAITPEGSDREKTVGLHSYVRYHDSETDSIQTVQIVYPHEADIALWKISVLTLVGAGLIGLSEGQSIDWPTRDGRSRTLSALQVGSAPFEALGEQQAN